MISSRKSAVRPPDLTTSVFQALESLLQNKLESRGTFGICSYFVLKTRVFQLRETMTYRRCDLVNEVAI